VIHKSRADATRAELLITNLRLGAHNGINLALLADRRHTTSIVSAVAHDAGSARDAQEAGATYELVDVLPMVLPDYMQQIATERVRCHSAQPGARS
jgi:hypothetical protein